MNFRRLTLSLLVFTVPGVVLAALPLEQRPATAKEWGYRPADGATVELNPPSFTWVAPAGLETYAVQWSADPAFPEATSTTVERVRWPTYTHDRPLKPGEYFWRYRGATPEGELTAWSIARRVRVPASAAELPMPTVAQQRARMPGGHPRLFLRPEDLPRIRALAGGRHAEAFARLRESADRIIAAGPTPEPAHPGSNRDKTNLELIKHWAPNRVQTEKACVEAETLAFVYLISGDKRYGEAARRWVLHLASWDPKGNTFFKLNCEAAKPMLFRPARAYDWAWDMFTPAERKKIQTVMRERLLDAWRSWEVQEGIGSLQRPFGSHANRIWHKMAEAAIAFIDEIPEAPQWLDFAVNRFFSAYPVWSDDDGGWHEGVRYWWAYQSKAVWWLQVAQSALGIEGMRKPFFAQVGDYPLYLAPPHSPNAGFGDLAHQPLDAPSFLEYHLRTRSASGEEDHAGYWAWWAEAKNMHRNGGVLGFLYEVNLPPIPAPKAPVDLPTSKVFHGIGVASLHTTLLDSRDDVHFAFKSSPFGSQSHGHNPQNSFFLNAYGEALLLANGYRDVHGSKFHYDYVHSTRAQNAVLVDGEGQIPHSEVSTGRIVREQIGTTYDYIAGDATPAYAGRLTKAWRHVLFIKKPVPFVILYDELLAPQPSTFQLMLHGPSAFAIDVAAHRLQLVRPKASVEIGFFSSVPLEFTQTDGFNPPPMGDFPNIWHVEIGTREHRTSLGLATLLVPSRAGHIVPWTGALRDSAGSTTLDVNVAGQQYLVTFPQPGEASPVRVISR